ncbi:MAG: Fe-S cluster assembly ATPase SufC [Bifidobacterium dentium]
MSTLEIKDLYAHVETKDGIKPILKGVNLTVNSGETHAIMGPNGSGKSTLAYTLAGHPKYVVDSGQVLLDGEDILKMTPDERAKAGIFLAMQYPVEVPGVSMTNFLRTAKPKSTARLGHPHVDQGTVRGDEAPEDGSEVRHTFRERGFSGGEKKRAEVLQLELLKPKFAILDETDSGLDVDALRIVSEGVNRAKEANQFGILMVTHYTRILKYIKPDIVHVFAAGYFVKTGGPELADELEESGYDAYLPEGSDSKARWHDRFCSDSQGISDP